MTVKQGQSLPDITLQMTGSIEDMIEMAIAMGIALTDELTVGTDVPEIEVSEALIVTNMENNGVVPASAISTATDKQVAGIGYWIVGTDFIVQ